jgi:hypothetical protein
VLVDELRVGRSVAFHRAQLVEDGETVVDARVTSGQLTSEAPLWLGAPAPELPDIDDCPKARTTGPDGTKISLFEHVDVRYDRASVRWAGPDAETQPPVIRAWVRIDDATDPYAVAVAADALPPAVFALGVRGWAPTVEMTTYLRSRPADGWLRVEARSELLAGGWFDEQARVWDAAGQLVGQARQLAMVGRQRKGQPGAEANDR